MQIRLIAVGKLRERYAEQACAELLKRLRPYWPVETTEVRASPGSQGDAVAQEGRRVLKLLDDAEPVWLLERNGTQLTSIALSERLAGVAAQGVRRLNLVVAGTFGAAPELQARANFLWSLSELTLLHEWARMLVLEQLYRSAKIARNEPYHH